MNQKILTASLAALVLTTGAFSVQAESPPEFLFVRWGGRYCEPYTGKEDRRQCGCSSRDSR